jgi:hypothetical protein
MFLETAFRRRALPSIALCATALGLATVGSAATARAASTTFYIATTGSDTNAGT